MSYLNTWHRDYAAEAILRAERDEKKFGNSDMAKASMSFAKHVVTCGQGAALAREAGVAAGSEKIVSIADTVLATIKANNRYKKVTPAQQHTLAVALLEKHGNARGIGAAIWGLNDAEIDNAEI